MRPSFSPSGVMPAALIPLTNDQTIDGVSYRSHLRALAGIRGLSGIVVNGHAAEVHALSLDEQTWGIQTACEEVGDQIPVIAGIYTESTRVACKMARRAADVGAQALLIFPPNSLMFGGNSRVELGRRFVEEVSAATALPVILFQYPISTALSYDIDSLVYLCEKVSNIVAIKDLGSEPRTHERTIAALHGLSRPVNVLTSHSQWLGASLCLGARGIISGAGSVIADRQRAMFEAFSCETPNLLLQRQLLAEMSLLVEAFYSPPYVDWQARMKMVLHRFGRIATAEVFSPLQTIGADDWSRIEGLLAKVNLTAETLYSK